MGMLKDRKSDVVVSYLLIAPAVAFMALFIFSPIAYSIALSTQTYRLGFKTRAFIGLGNYAELFASADFWNSLRITAVYTVVVVAASLGEIPGMGFPSPSTTVTSCLGLERALRSSS